MNIRHYDIKKLFCLNSVLFFTLLFYITEAYSYSTDKPNIILIVMDTVRRSNLSCYGYDRRNTPNIDKIAEESMVFENAYAISCWTPPNHAAMFTGLYSCQHRVTQENQYLEDEYLTLAEILSDNGYNTSAFVNNSCLSQDFGFEQGFKCFKQVWDLEEDEKYFDMYGGDAGALITGQLVKDWIKQYRRSSTPFFVFINYMEAHSPYDPPDEFMCFYLDKNTKVERYVRKYDYVGFLSGAYHMSLPRILKS